MSTKEPAKKTILILEDNPMVLAHIAYLLQRLESEVSVRFIPVSFPTVEEAHAYLTDTGDAFDIVLLDRNDKSGNSYHTLDLEKIGVQNIISISSVPRNNEEARQRGVTRVVEKQYEHMDAFSHELERHIRALL